MIRALFLLISIGFFFTASAQKPTYYQGLGLQMKQMWADSVARIPSDTTVNKTGIARIGTTIYAGNGTYWTAAAGGGSTDTTSLSNRINLKLNISDTAAMLANYLRAIDTTGKWVHRMYKNATADSFVYEIGTMRFAFKDSSGIGSFARDTVVAGRGLTGTPITATKVQLDNDSAIYIVTQINDTTLSFTHYDGRIDTVTIVSSGGGGGSGWGFAGDSITTGQFLGTTNNEPLVFKFNGNDRGIISGTNIAFGSFINAGVGNAGFGDDALLSATSNTNYNTALGAISLQVLDNGNNNTAVGYNSLSGITAGKANTAIGAETTLATLSSTDSSIAIGYEAVASTKQLAFSPHVTEIKATGITGASNSGYVLTTDGSGIATFQARLPYQVVVGNLTQTSTSDPTFTQFENTTGTTITTTRSATGIYLITSSGTPFTANKTAVFISVNGASSSIRSIFYEVTSTSTVQVTTTDGFGTDADDILNNTSIEIRIYP